MKLFTEVIQSEADATELKVEIVIGKLPIQTGVYVNYPSWFITLQYNKTFNSKSSAYTGNCMFPLLFLTIILFLYMHCIKRIVIYVVAEVGFN